ncbi:hypothetical protein N7G274_002787 [Stereocaulon virgatum]|uniref:Uncharacterized protein n=1 Tax=Stereocaulon virgatum TaxID=373712 RepID=A0ABR4AGT9_9LECA
MSSSDADTVTYNGINSVEGFQLTSQGISSFLWQHECLISTQEAARQMLHLLRRSIEQKIPEGKTHCVALPEDDPDIFFV